MRHSLEQVVDIIVKSKEARNLFLPRFWLTVHDHDTGTHVTIEALMGEERLNVWEYEYWKSKGYEFNNRGKTLGLQLSGPWADQIDDILDAVETVETERQRAELAKEEQAAQDRQTETERKIERFRKHFSGCKEE